MISSPGMLLERIVENERLGTPSERIMDSLYRLASDRIVPNSGSPVVVGDRSEGAERPHLPSDANNDSNKTSVANGDQSTKRSGRWSMDEKILFLYGLRRFGKGRWKKISIYLPDRSLVQIKSHAQKVLKRLESGENVFRRLHENVRRTDALVQAIHCKYGLDSPEWWTTKRKVQDAADVAEQFDAASALCQLSSHASAENDVSSAASSRTTPEIL